MRDALPGFMLIEAVIYAGIFILISMLMAQFSVMTVRHTNSIHAALQRHVEQSNAVRLLQRDIQQAPWRVDRWQKTDLHALVWQTEREAVGWLYEQEKLYRIHGQYDAQADRWQSRAKQLVARKIADAQFVLVREHNNSVRAVQCTLRSKGQREATRLTIGLANRLLS